MENNNNQNSNDAAASSPTLTKSLDENIKLFNNIFSDNAMLFIRKLKNKYLDSSEACILYLQGMTDSSIINENIIQPFLLNNLAEDVDINNLFDELLNKVFVSDNIRPSSDFNEMIDSMISGETIFLLNGFNKVIIVNAKDFQQRSVSEPISEKSVRGPREGFTEYITTNITLLRRKVKDPGLKFKFSKVGTKTGTNICLSYIEGLASESILKELENRLNSINIDGILDSGYIQELIKDAPFSPFDTVGYSEKPDTIAANILEGRIAVFVDGSPFVLTVPFIIAEYLQVSEDYYNNFIFASINRFIRTISLFASIFVPSLYLAVATYHQEMLPTPLLVNFSASRQGVPIPSVLSMFIMLLIFDILREAGTRIPSPIGQAVNIVGTLVLGQAAVEARLVSAPIIIITAVTGITTLINPKMLGSVIIIRTFLLFGTAFLGIYGFLFNFFIVVFHLMSIRSFGVPYMLNLSRISDHNSQDVWIRAPWWTMTLRPKIVGARNPTRQSKPGSGGKQQL